MSEPLVVDDRDGVRWIWFARPAVHNAQDMAMLEQLDDVLAATAGDPSVRAVVIAGEGRSFCSGHDLREMSANPRYAQGASTPERRYDQEERLFTRPIERLYRLPVPVVCRVQGYCLAAGLMFVAAADLVVSADDARFGSPILAALGVNDAEVPGFAWIVGERRAKQALWLNETLDASEALACGLVNWVVPLDELDATVDAVTAKLAAIPRAALQLSKASFEFAARRQGRDDSFAYHYVAHQLSHHTDAARQLLSERMDRVATGGTPIAANARPDTIDTDS